ncbi:bifunctional diaminohydroxyphosphoribosylaminopyrimidine deaminase/5-amino-6-(5-phosphoribosylamino)uracil reductase RibD [Rathayibacter sp. VKM Ac-2760]|nr:bifunctional diaminohydroxyphosphoribosylaminopyrimidine deaminase/5-amino-6-(5-phosphoribosylamino)uracil reductase RibD [Rathayibacter sp. VKM Ac-2760]
MRRALALAQRGPARGVNPRVGCVLLAPDGSVLAEGWHHGAGTAHAEVDALAQLAPGAATGATAVVSLEPCNHVGRTGPCSRALIDAGVTRVVYAVGDPGVRSAGGADTLRAAGVDVVEGVLAEQAEEFLHVWLTATRRRRPWVSLKWASTLDGRTAAADGSSRWITGAAARQRVHEQRTAADAILVGTGTVLADDPSLTARGDSGELLAEQPLPVVVGTRAVPAGARVLGHPRRAVLERTHDLAAVLDRLYDAEVRHVYVEGGPTLASALVAAGLVDEFLVYLAPALLGGPRLALGDLGVESIAGAHRLDLRSVEILGDDLLVTARPGSPAGRPPAPQKES